MIRQASVCVLVLVSVFAAVTAKTVTLDNTKLPLDNRGEPLITGEADVLIRGADMYFYFNDWGGCPGVDCCSSSGGCASCCFTPNDPCVYTNNHSVVAYHTTDLETWTYLGVALSSTSFVPGVEFRPHVVYNAKTDLYVMWYEDRWTQGKQEGYAIATSKVPGGPFTPAYHTVKMATSDKIGDFDILVDDDGVAYHARTGLVIEQLNDDYTSVTGKYIRVDVGGNEGTTFFKYRSLYYLVSGHGCCACLGGSNIDIYASSSPLGPYRFLGDAGSNTTAPFDPHSPYNYPTRAQASKVFPVGEDTMLYMGNQWVTSKEPGRPRNHDLLYWTPLNFTADGNISQVIRQDSVTISL